MLCVALLSWIILRIKAGILPDYLRFLGENPHSKQDQNFGEVSTFRCEVNTPPSGVCIPFGKVIISSEKVDTPRREVITLFGGVITIFR